MDNENKMTCSTCPCGHMIACIAAGYMNGDEFGSKLRKEIMARKQQNDDVKLKLKGE